MLQLQCNAKHIFYLSKKNYISILCCNLVVKHKSLNTNSKKKTKVVLQYGQFTVMK